MRRSPLTSLAPHLVSAAALAAITLGAGHLEAAPSAARTLTEYRYFRALMVDLQGRVPSRAELVAFEKPAFDVDKFIDTALTSQGYASRVRRLYMDLLRLDVGSTFAFRPNASVLRRQTLQGPDGKKIYVYYRNGQRRTREATDGVFCLTKEETGVAWTTNGNAIGTPINTTQAALDANTTVVKPWWLYKDFKEASPTKLYGTGWTPADASFALIPELLTEADGTTTTTEVRVCKEEASTANTGTVYWTGRKAPVAGTPIPYERVQALPLDDTYATTYKGQSVACDSGTAITHSTECGCGVGLEKCMPAAGNGTEPNAFTLPSGAMMGIDKPTSIEKTTAGAWHRQWWSQEAVRYVETIAREDRDFRQILTGKWTTVNGPLTQFYKYHAPANCCGNAYQFGLAHPEGLVDATKLPALAPYDVAEWKMVADRGPQASGILTMPVFLSKYGTRRGRAHVIYNVFQCRQFVAEEVKLEPSNEPDLSKRAGCATCHAKLEPMSAYFTRVLESDWTFLPKELFPADNATCRNADPKKISGQCRNYYDPAFVTTTNAFLRGAHAAPANADAGPAGLGKEITESPEFARCVVSNVTSSFLGRQLGTEDGPMMTKLEEKFVEGGFKLRTLIRLLVKERAYASANNLTSDAWRAQEGQ